MSNIKENKVYWIKVFINFGLPLMLFLIPTNDVFTREIRLFLVVTLIAIISFALETMHLMAVSIALPIAYWLFNIAPAGVVYSSWTQVVPWMVLGGMLLANIMNRVGLLKRIAYRCIILTGGTYTGIILGIALASVVIYILMPGNTFIVFAALGFGICKALDLKPSKEAAGIMFATAFACVMPSHFLFTEGYFLYGGYAAASGYNFALGWLDFIIKQWPAIFYYAIMIFILLKICKPKEDINGKDYFISEYNKMGKMTTDEKKCLITLFLLLLFLLTGEYHHILVSWGFVLAPLLLYVPGFNVGTTEDIKNTDFTTVFFTAGCLSIGAVSGALGLGAVVTNTLVPMLAGHSNVVVFGSMYVILFLLNFLMTPTAIAASFALPLVNVAMALGLNPDAVILFMMHALDQIILPYEYVMYLVFFGFGMIKIKDFVTIMGIKTIVNFVFVLAILIPYWTLTGFIYM